MRVIAPPRRNRGDWAADVIVVIGLLILAALAGYRYGELHERQAWNSCGSGYVIYPQRQDDGSIEYRCAPEALVAQAP